MIKAIIVPVKVSPDKVRSAAPIVTAIRKLTVWRREVGMRWDVGFCWSDMMDGCDQTEIGMLVCVCGLSVE